MDGLPGFKMHVVVAPVVGQIRSNEDDIAGLKPFDMIAYELRAAAFVEEDQFHFRVIVPAVVDERVPVLSDAKGLRGSFWDF